MQILVNMMIQKKDKSESRDENQEKEEKNITEEGVEKFLDNDAQGTEQDATNGTAQDESAVSSDIMPEIGMQFKSREDAQQYLSV
jgi:hypothetical protein